MRKVVFNGYTCTVHEVRGSWLIVTRDNDHMGGGRFMIEAGHAREVQS